MAELTFPDDAQLAISILKRFTEWLATERARTGQTDAEIIAQYSEGFDINDADLTAFLKELRNAEL